MGKPFGFLLDFVGENPSFAAKNSSSFANKSLRLGFNMFFFKKSPPTVKTVYLWCLSCVFFKYLLCSIYIYIDSYLYVFMYLYIYYVQILFHDQAWLAWRRLRVFLWLSVVGEASAECPWFWVFDVVICQAGITNIASSCSDVLVYICICLQTYACMCEHVRCSITYYIPDIYICMYLLHVF